VLFVANEWVRRRPNASVPFIHLGSARPPVLAVPRRSQRTCAPVRCLGRQLTKFRFRFQRSAPGLPVGASSRAATKIKVRIGESRRAHKVVTQAPPPPRSPPQARFTTFSAGRQGSDRNFTKIKCFCFTQQTAESGLDARDMKTVCCPLRRSRRSARTTTRTKPPTNPYVSYSLLPAARAQAGSPRRPRRKQVTAINGDEPRWPDAQP